ncbi:hypothetical protein ABIA23_003325 [Sinorhizobium fredii]
MLAGAGAGGLVVSDRSDRGHQQAREYQEPKREDGGRGEGGYLTVPYSLAWQYCAVCAVQSVSEPI